MTSDLLIKQLIDKIMFQERASKMLFLYPEEQVKEGNNYRFPKEIFSQFSSTKTYNPLDVEGFIENLQQEEFSQVFIWPMFLGRRDLPAEIQHTYPGMDLHEIFLLKLAQFVSSGTTVSAILPTSFLTSNGSEIARRNIFTEAPVNLIINNPFVLDAGLFLGIHPLFRLSIITMRKGGVKSPLRFFSIPEKKFETKDVLEDLKHLLAMNGGKTSFGFIHREVIIPGEKLIYETHHPDLIKKSKDMAAYGNIITLGDLTQVFSGINISQNSQSLLPVDNSTEGILVIEGRNILRNGEISFEAARYQIAKADMPAGKLLQAGDYCIRAHYSFSNSGENFNFIISEIRDGSVPLAVSNTVIVIRPKEDLSKEQREFLFAYLKSDIASELLRSKSGPGLASINIKDLSGLPLPQPDGNLLFAIKSLNESANQFDVWKKEVEEARNSLFANSLFEDARLGFLAAGRLARQRQEAGVMVENFAFRIHTQFPHPVAYRWRLVETSEPVLEGYTQVLECAEITIGYLAIMAILLARSVGIEVAQVSQVAMKLASDIKQGITFGEWAGVLREVNSKKFRKISGVIPFYEVLSTFSDSAVDVAVKRLEEKRNDLAHKRGPKGSKAIHDAYLSAKIDLEKLLASVDFLSEYRLRYIENTRKDSLKKNTNYDYRDLQGDHPLVPIQNAITTQDDIEAGSLYLVDRQGSLHLLRPYLTRRECPECGNWSIFCLDTYDKKTNSVNLVSMEHGHFITDTELAEVFRIVGLLK